MGDEENPLRTASEVARAGRLTDAIACLEAVLARTRPNASRPANTPILAKTAGLFCEWDGKLLVAAGYYEEATAMETPEPLTLLALADVYSRLGRVNEAQACLTKADSLAKASSDEDALRMVATTRARWTGGNG
jgi:tetratricopeptide (TPR) repeat protein